MSLTSGFFDSVNHDRTYNAEQMGSLFNGIIRDGVFKDYPSAGENLTIRGKSTDVLTVSVGPGRAWFNSIWIDNDSNFDINLASHQVPQVAVKVAIVLEVRKNPEGTLPRQARIIAESNGTATLPTISHDVAHNIYRYRFGWVEVPSGQSSGGTTYKYSTNDSKIHNTVGVEAGVEFVAAPLQHITAENVLSEWHNEVSAMVSQQLSTYLGNDASPLYELMVGNTKKVFFYIENPQNEHPNWPYYGVLSSTIGATATLRSRAYDSNPTAGGMGSGTFTPSPGRTDKPGAGTGKTEKYTMVVGSLIIGNSGNIGRVTNLSMTTEGSLQYVTVETVGNLNAMAKTANLRLDNTSNVFIYQRDLDENSDTYVIDGSKFISVHPPIEYLHANLVLPKVADIFVSKNGVITRVNRVAITPDDPDDPTSTLTGEIGLIKLFKLPTGEGGGSTPVPQPLELTFGMLSGRALCDHSFEEIQNAITAEREIKASYVKMTPGGTFIYERIGGTLTLRFSDANLSTLTRLQFKVLDIDFHDTADTEQWSWTSLLFTVTPEEVTVVTQ